MLVLFWTWEVKSTSSATDLQCILDFIKLAMLALFKALATAKNKVM